MLVFIPAAYSVFAYTAVESCNQFIVQLLIREWSIVHNHLAEQIGFTFSQFNHILTRTLDFRVHFRINGFGAAHIFWFSWFAVGGRRSCRTSNTSLTHKTLKILNNWIGFVFSLLQLLQQLFVLHFSMDFVLEQFIVRLIVVVQQTQMVGQLLGTVKISDSNYWIVVWQVALKWEQNFV